MVQQTPAHRPSPRNKCDFKSSSSTRYLSDSVEEVLDPCEAESCSPRFSLCFRGEVDGGIAGSLNSRGCVQEGCLLPAATEGGLIRAAQLPGRASSSDSELTSWWVYWWISFSLRIIWRFGKGRTPNLRGEGDELLRTLHPDQNESKLTC